MRLLPRSWRLRVGLAAVALAALALASWVDRYRPWEAHFRGVPTSRWASRYAGWKLDDQWFGRDSVIWYLRYGQDPVPPPFWHRWAAAVGIHLTWDPAQQLVNPESEELMRGDTDSVPVLLEMLRHRSPEVREVAVYGLAVVGKKSPEAMAALVSAVNGNDAQAQQFASYALSKLNPSAKAPPTPTERAIVAIEAIGGSLYHSGLNGRERYVVKLCERTTDADLASLKDLKNVEILHIYSENITEPSLAQLEQLAELRELHLSSCSKITDAGLERLRSLTRLEVLELDSTKVTGDGLRHLKGLKNLTALNLNYCPLTDAGLDPLKDNRRLKRFSLAGTAVTDDGLARLATMSELTELNLTGTRVSDAGLAHLKGLNQLGILTLFETKVTDKGVADLKKSLSQLTVVR